MQCEGLVKEMARPQKHLILFIVEGTSDVAALETCISELLDGNQHNLEARFINMNTDVTSDFRNNPRNITENINRHYLMKFFQGNDYYFPKDVYEVVQICDLDGTFIPEENCRQFTELNYLEEGFYYDPPYIFGATAETVQDRNQRKSENIQTLLSQNTIKVKTKKKPYSLYYFSSNLDHFLHDEINLEKREKIDKAKEFAEQFEGKPYAFVDFFCQHPYSSKNMTYEESWRYMIDNGTNSLMCFTNFNLYLEKLVSILNSDITLI